jgi:hypothetical protein
MTEKRSIEVKFNLDEVTNQFLFHVKETIDCENQIYHAVNETSIKNKPLPSDSLPIYVDDKRLSLTVAEQKEKTIKWLFKKAFEEFVAGLTKSLIEAFCFVKFQRLSLSTFDGTKEQLEEELKKVRISANNAHFPVLIDHIEKELGDLDLVEEIRSINRIRNCMVHRDGVVQEKDLKDSSSGKLILKWISIKNYTIRNGERIALDYRTREHGILIQNMEVELVRNEKQFKLNDKIEINLNEFNEISYTCSEFVNALLRTILKKCE